MVGAIGVVKEMYIEVAAADCPSIVNNQLRRLIPCCHLKAENEV